VHVVELEHVLQLASQVEHAVSEPHWELELQPLVQQLAHLPLLPGPDVLIVGV